MKGLVWAVCLFGLGGLVQFAATPAAPQSKENIPAAGGRVRTYYIAAEELEWDYAPLGIDVMTGKPFEETAAAYTQPGPNHIGHVYRKAVYHEYDGPVRGDSRASRWRGDRAGWRRFLKPGVRVPICELQPRVTAGPRIRWNQEMVAFINS